MPRARHQRSEFATIPMRTTRVVSLLHDYHRDGSAQQTGRDARRNHDIRQDSRDQRSRDAQGESGRRVEVRREAVVVRWCLEV